MGTYQQQYKRVITHRQFPKRQYECRRTDATGKGK